MLISNTVKMRWNSKNKAHYLDLGYIFTKMKDEFVINVFDLPHGSKFMVNVKCDYCGKLYQKHWNNYCTEKGVVNKDSCNDCKHKKTAEVLLYKYNVTNPFCMQDVIQSMRKNWIEKYGVDNPSKSDIVKRKIRQTNAERYGAEYAMQNDAIKEKAKKNLSDAFRSGRIKVKHGKEHFAWKGGVKYHRQERSTHEYIEWRKNVFLKSNYICQKCGKHTNNLNAHHINNWKDYPKLRYDVENGVCLCADCHCSFHSIYGKRYNTKEQIDVFLADDKKIC